MVGTQASQGCGVLYDGDGEGHGGALVTAVADQNQLPGWLAATHPDVVMMHFGPGTRDRTNPYLDGAMIS
jgi:hypothetical protein